MNRLWYFIIGLALCSGIANGVEAETYTITPEMSDEPWLVLEQAQAGDTVNVAPPRSRPETPRFCCLRVGNFEKY